MNKLIFMLFGRSRSGKSTILKAMTEYHCTFLSDLNIHVMTPLTTRPRRDGETNRDYRFVDLKSYSDPKYLNEYAKETEEKFGISFAGVENLEDWVHRAKIIMPNEIPTLLLEHRSYDTLDADGDPTVWEYGFLRPTDPINIMIGTPEVYRSIMKLNENVPENHKYIVVPIYIDRDDSISAGNRDGVGENSKEAERRKAADDRDFSEEVIQEILKNNPTGRFLNCEPMYTPDYVTLSGKFEDFLKSIEEYIKYYIYNIFGNESFGEPMVDEESGHIEKKMFRCKNCDHVYAQYDQLCPKCLGELEPISSCGLSFMDYYTKHKETNEVYEHVKVKEIRGGGITCSDMDALKEAYVKAGAYTTMHCKNTMEEIEKISEKENIEYMIEYPTIELECDEHIGSVTIEKGNRYDMNYFENIDCIISYDSKWDKTHIYIVMRDILKTYETYHVSSLGYQFGVCRQKFFKNAMRLFANKLKFHLTTET